MPRTAIVALPANLAPIEPSGNSVRVTRINGGGSGNACAAADPASNAVRSAIFMYVPQNV
jgi:hypothetical protein